VVVAVTVVVSGAAVVTVVILVVVVLVVIDVGAEVDDVVSVAQDAKTRDVTMRQVSTIQIIPLFIQTSLYFRLRKTNHDHILGHA
jgi:hypothetical protein